MFKDAWPGSEGVCEGIASRAGGSRVPHASVRHVPGGSSAAPRGACETLDGGGARGISRLVQPDVGRGAHGCRWGDIPRGTTISRGTSCRSASIDTGLGGGPPPHDNAPRGATARTAGRERLRGGPLDRLVLAGMALPDQQAHGREREGTAGMAHAKVADVHTALRQDVWEAPAETRHAVEGGGTEAGTAHLPVSDGDSDLSTLFRTKNYAAF